MLDRGGMPDRAPLTESPTVELICQLARCQRVLQGLLTQMADRWQLSGNELLVLWLCARDAESGLSQRDLAATVGISPARMSGLIEGLRSRQLVSPWRCSRDRRRQYWRVQPDGWRLLRSAAEVMEQFARSHFADVSSAAQTELASHIQRLADLAENAREQDRPTDVGADEDARMEADDDRVYRQAS